jgi:hypothetical protein
VGLVYTRFARRACCRAPLSGTLSGCGLAHYATHKFHDESHVISAEGRDNVCIFCPPPRHIMALPKSMRILAGATICVFLFLFVKILNAPSGGGLQVPTKVPLSKDGQWDHDPQSDRMSIRDTPSWYGAAAYQNAQHPENPRSLSGESTETTTHRTTRRARASTPPS